MKESEFCEVYNSYYSLVTKIAYNVIEDYHLAQDITQEVFVILVKKWDTIQQERLKGWLIRCTTRRALDYRRKKYFDREVPDDFHDYDELHPMNVEQEIIFREIYGDIFLELYHKNRKWYDLICRLDLYGEDSAGLAREMSITQNTLRVRHHRAKQWLGTRIHEENPDVSLSERES